jgi:hypothetical protein
MIIFSGLVLDRRLDEWRHFAGASFGNRFKAIRVKA